jgi:DNA-directed RNA polymerase subunit RPC12/RpoP
LNWGEKKSAVYETCPHCGRPLSPWEQVLLSVDRALMCKSCWYRIYLDPVEEKESKEKTQEHKSKTKE